MSKLLNKIKKKMEVMKTTSMQYLGDDFDILLTTMNETVNFLKLSDDEQVAFLQSRVLDPETGKPVFTLEYMENEMVNSYLTGLAAKYFTKCRGIDDVEEASEKN